MWNPVVRIKVFTFVQICIIVLLKLIEMSVKDPSPSILVRIKKKWISALCISTLLIVINVEAKAIIRCSVRCRFSFKKCVQITSQKSKIMKNSSSDILNEINKNQLMKKERTREVLIRDDRINKNLRNRGPPRLGIEMSSKS